MAAISTGTRLVPLASAGAMPRNINNGKETAEPLEATVLRKPHSRPANIATAISIFRPSLQALFCVKS